MNGGTQMKTQTAEVKKCQSCSGIGRVTGAFHLGGSLECPTCGGLGIVEENELRIEFGAMLGRWRLDKRLSLRRFCEQGGYDQIMISKIERGLIP